jgi:hypothetical protein
MHIYTVLHTNFCVYSVPKRTADRPCHGKFKKLSLKVETKMVPQRKTIPSWTKFNKVQNIFTWILYSKFRRIACTKFITAYRAKVLERGDAGQKKRREAKTARTAKKEGGNGFQSNGSCGFLGGLRVSTISQWASAAPSGQFGVRHFLGLRSSFFGQNGSAVPTCTSKCQCRVSFL